MIFHIDLDLVLPAYSGVVASDCHTEIPGIRAQSPDVQQLIRKYSLSLYLPLMLIVIVARISGF